MPKRGVANIWSIEFDIPHSIAIDPRGNIYVGDRTNHNLGQFSGAHALACPTERERYVGETSNWRVQKLLLR